MTSFSRSVLCRAAANATIARHCSYALAVAATVGISVSKVPSAQAANDAYAVDATSGLFSTSFTLGVTTPTTGGTSSPATGDALFFGTETTGTTTVSNDLTGFTFAGLTFNALASSFTISGNAFSLSGPILNSSQNLQTINNAITLTAASTFTSGINGGNLVLNGAISGTSAITFAGSGFTTLTGNNSGYSGTTVLSGAGNAVRITNANALGTGALNMGAGSTTLELSGGITFSNSVTSLTGRTSPFLRNFAGTNTYSGTVTQTATGGGTDVESAGGFLNFTGTLTSSVNNSPRVLYVTGAGDGSFTSASTINGTTTGTTLSAFNQVTKTGGGTWTLAGSATAILSGATIIQGGTLGIDNTTGTFGSGGALTFSGNGGTFNFIGNAAGTAKTLGALTFTLGRGIPQITNNGGTTALTFASLAARAAGATGNFVTSGGTVGTPGVAGTDKFLFTTTPTTLSTSVIDPGLFFNGSSYAAYDATSGVRALVYGGTDTATTFGAGTSVTGTNVQITGDQSAQATTALNTLNLSGDRNLTLASGATLTVNGLLQTGGTTGSTISGGTGIQAGTGAEMVIRTDGAADALTISTPVLANGANALTKTGAGTLTLSGANTYTGNTNLLQGTLNLTGTNIGAGTTTVQSGTLNLTGAGGLTGSTTVGTLLVSPAAGGLATVNINTSGTAAFGLGAVVGTTVANIASTVTNSSLGLPVGVLNMQAGTLTTGGTATQRDLQTGASGFGTTNVSGGTVNVGGFLTVGFNAAGSAGIVNISGGTVQTNLTGGAGVAFGSTLGASANTTGQLNLSGGALTLNSTNALGSIFVGENGVGTLNVSGTGVATLGGSAASGGLTIGGNTGTAATGSGVVNLGAVGAGGGTIITDTVRRGGAVATTQGILNFHGGTLQSSATPATTFMTGLTNAYVYSEGGTINNNAQAITIAQSLLAPTGSGITAIAVSAGGTNYATAPLVVISGGGGTGATAVATVNGSGVVTGFTITNPGTGYTSQPTITLLGGSLSGSTPATIGAATLTANTSGGLTFGGAGTTTLTGVNTYRGATAINAGILSLKTGSMGGTAVTATGGLLVSGAYTLGTSGSASLTLAPTTGTVSLLDATLNTLTINNATAGATALTIGGGNTLSFDAGAATSDLINLGAGLLATAAGGNTVNINLLARPPGTQTLTLINAPGGFAGSSNFTLGTVTGVATSANSFGLSLALASTATQLQLVETATAAPATAYFTGSLGASWAANNGTIGNFSTDFAGTNGVTQLPGAATDVHFYATNANLTNVAASTLDSAFTIKSLTVDGSTLGESNAVGIAAGTGGTLTITPTSATTGITVNSGAGAVTISAPVTLGAAQTWTNNSANLLTVSGAVTNGGNTLALAGSGNTTLSGVNSGTGGLTMNGVGTLTLLAANTYTGATTVTAGTVKNGIANALPVATALTLSGGTYDMNGFAQTLGNLSDGGASAGILTNSNATALTLIVNSTAATTYSGALTGNLALFEGGTSVLTIAGANNTFTGGTTIGNSNTNDVIRAAATQALGTGAIGILGNGGTNELQVAGNISLNNPIILSAKTAVATGPGIEAVSGASTLSGTVTFTSGGAFYTVQADTGSTLTFSNATAAFTGGATTGARTLTLQGAGSTVISGPIVNGSAAVAVSEAGPGVGTLSAANTFTGGTVVSAGTLLVNGSTVSGNATSVTGGTLGGTGTISGTVAVAMGGTIAPGPGNAVGNLTTGALTLASGSTLSVFIASDSSFSQLLAASTSASGAFSVTLPAGATFAGTGEVLTIIPSGFTGTFTNSTFAAGGYTFTADYTTTAGGFDLDVTVPEPTTVLGGVLLMAAAGYRQRRRLSSGWQAVRRSI